MCRFDSKAPATTESIAASNALRTIDSSKSSAASTDSEAAAIGEFNTDQRIGTHTLVKALVAEHGQQCVLEEHEVDMENTLDVPGTSTQDDRRPKVSFGGLLMVDQRASDIELPPPRKHSFRKFSPPPLTMLEQSPTADKDEVAQVFPDAGLELVFELHKATLVRSFAKIGKMNPYAIVSVNGREVGRTSVAQGMHKAPVWEFRHKFTEGNLPNEIKVGILGKNQYLGDICCGTAVVPCSHDVGVLEAKDFCIEKRGKPTGVICATLKVVDSTTGEAPEHVLSA